MKKMMTETQAKYLEVIADFIIEHGACPNYRHISEIMGCTFQNAWGRVKGIENRGWLKRGKAGQILSIDKGFLKKRREQLKMVDK